MKRIVCILDMSETDNTTSAGKSWKNIFVSYLSHLLSYNYKIEIEFLKNDQLNSLEGDKINLLYLQLISVSNHTFQIPELHPTTIEKFEYIGLLKDSIALIPHTHSANCRFFDFRIPDQETNLPINSEELFEKQNLDIFLSKIADLSFEINHIFYPLPQKSVNSIYLAETTYELAAARFALKKELIKRGYQVLPEKSFFATESAITEQIKSDLKNTALSIHFFGSITPSNHPQAGCPVEILQNSIASDFFLQQSSSFVNGENVSYDFRRIIWFPENINAKDEKHLKYLDSLKHDPSLYAGADLIRSTLEELKEIILQKLSGHNANANAAPIKERIENKISEVEHPVVTRTSSVSSIPGYTEDQYSRIIQENNFSQ